MDDHRDSLRSNSRSLMTIGIFRGLPVVSGLYRDSLRSTSGILMTIGKVGGLPVVSG